MSYLIGRVFRDVVGYIYHEHRPGYYRREGAPPDPQTEHPITAVMADSMAIHPGTYVIEEEPY